MKKEIEEFQGKDTYKKDWNADYKSGKDGKGIDRRIRKTVLGSRIYLKYLLLLIVILI